VTDARRINKAAPSLDQSVFAALGCICQNRDPEQAADSIRLGVRCLYSKKVEIAPLRPEVVARSTFHPSPARIWSSAQPVGVDNQVSSQALELLNLISRKRGGVDAFCEIYFCTFHRPLPIVDKDDFYDQLRLETMTSDFSVLVLSIILIVHLSSQIVEAAEIPRGLFPALKSMYSVLQSMGKFSIELIQAGVHIASYEHCQALGQDAWLSIGSCARMAHILGLHRTIKSYEPAGEVPGDRVETKRCLWWGIVVLERYD
jgi:Fungal specific transcription factor domain